MLPPAMEPLLSPESPATSKISVFLSGSAEVLALAIPPAFIMAAALLCYPILVTGTIFTSICAAFIAARTEAHNHHITWQFMWWVVAWIYTSSYATTISFALSPLPSWPSIAAGMIALSIILLLSEFTFHLFTTVRGKSLTLGSFGTMHSMIWGSLGKRWEGLQMSWEGLGALLHQVVGVFFGRHHATNLTSDNPAQASMLPPPYEYLPDNQISSSHKTILRSTSESMV